MACKTIWRGSSDQAAGNSIKSELVELHHSTPFISSAYYDANHINPGAIPVSWLYPQTTSGLPRYKPSDYSSCFSR